MHGVSLSTRLRWFALPYMLLCWWPGTATCAGLPATDSAPLEEVIVTARRREERALDVPISLTAIPGEELEARGDYQLQRILPQLPNVNMDLITPRLMTISIRGLGRNPGVDGLEASAGVFLDGVYLGRLGMSASDLTDLEQLEVFRGPQGTLFGKNTTAGVVNIRTRAPGFEREAALELTAGDAGLRELRAAVGGPLVKDTLAWRLSGFGTRRDGFTSTPQGELGELHRSGVRGQLLWHGPSDLRLRIIGDFGEQDEHTPAVVLVDPVTQYNTGAIRPNNFMQRAARAGYTPLIEPFARRTDVDAGMRITTRQAGLSAEIDAHIRGLDFTSISAWRNWHTRPATDGDLTGLDVQPRLGFEVRDSQYSQELRLASAADAPLGFVAGAYLFAQRLDSKFTSLFGADAADYLQAGLPSYFLDGFRVTALTDPATDSGALFGQVNWRFAGRFEAALGARWTSERKRAHIVRSNSGGAPLLAGDTAAFNVRAQFGAPASADVSTSEDFASGLASLSYAIADDARAYLSVSHGAKSGGINTAIVPPGLDQVLRPEIATSFELGLKLRGSSGRWQFNAAAFDMEVKDYQAAVREPIRGNILLDNAASLRSWGVEFEGAWQPIDRANLALAAGWNDARFESFPSSVCPPEAPPQPNCDLAGTRVPGAQPWSVSLDGDYFAPINSGAQELFGGFEYFSAGGYRSDLSSHTAIPAYDLLNLRLGVRARTRSWEVWLWARNVLDEDYFATKALAGSFNTGAVFGIVADPRTYGLSARISL